MSSTSRRYSPEVRERAVRLVLEQQREHESQWAAIRSVAAKMGCTDETLRTWVRRAEVDGGRRAGVTSEERARLKELERENRELRRANEILKSASAFLRDRARRSNQEVIAYIDKHRDVFGVEPICSVLQFAPRTYYAAKATAALGAGAARRGAEAGDRPGAPGQLRRLWRRQGLGAAEPRRHPGGALHVARLMRELGSRGVCGASRNSRRSPADQAERPRDLVDRRFHAGRPEPPMGGGLDLRSHLPGLRLRRLHHRRLLTDDRRLAGLSVSSLRSRSRCPREGDLGRAPRRRPET